MDIPHNLTLDDVSTNRQIKDGVFRLLFESPENAAELYYALTGIKCSPSEIQIITITTVISGKLKNDLAFVVRGKAIVVGEHMSSPYANMPIRMLMYIGQLYEKWIKMKGEEQFLYHGKLYKIPTPEFVIFYNGAAERPETEILRLSSAFEVDGEKTLGFLELEVPVYNINKGMNTELFKKSEKLRQYSEFVGKLRDFMKDHSSYSEVVKKTVDYCIANDILKEFLREHGGEVVSILSMEYDLEIAKRVYGEELMEDVAEKMLRKGEPAEKIVEYTGLPLNVVEAIQQNIRI